MNYLNHIRASRSVALLVLLIAVLVGCPDGYGSDGGNDEVGDTGGDDDVVVDDPDPEPVDPLGGGMASSCATQASGGPSNPAPASLGNGLVHDSRLSLSKQVHKSLRFASALAGGVPWSEFVGHYNSMAEFGFRPVQLRSEVKVTPGGVAKTVTIKVKDRSVYVSDDDANYLRWTGTSFDADDPDYEARYKMFHEQAIATMDFAGTSKEGRLLRPSGTLHIFEGDELVLNRAYTFAPMIYPDTPICKPTISTAESAAISAACCTRAPLPGRDLQTRGVHPRVVLQGHGQSH